MACEKCEKAHKEGSVAPIRVGNKEIGWGTVLIGACRDHAKLVIDWVNYQEQAVKELAELHKEVSDLHQQVTKYQERGGKFN
jgi:hypothetical protein